MKDTNNHVQLAPEKDFSTHISNGTRPTAAFQDGKGSQPADVTENDIKIPRRYSFDDNGGGYLGL